MQPTSLISPLNPSNKLAQVPIIDLRPILPHHPKYTWESLKGPRRIEDITTIVFHHTAISKASSAMYTDEQMAVRIAQSHIKSTKNLSSGEPGMPYHIYIRSGKMYIVNNFEAFTYGVASNNGYTLHIAVEGDYVNVDSLTDQDRDALYAAFFYARSHLKNYRKLSGHKELSATSCPGYDMNRVRKDLAQIELDLSLIDTPNDVQQRIFGFKARMTDLFNKGLNPSDPNYAAAQAKLMDILQIAIDKGYYVP
ncbi:peptidoglycan recognition protein family protein [Cohnella nanjingensis]|uniref:N-acetylmuramoyl-L-alanine amidase n=1 Tax=Cohnella nanjingensis TaxID=1387779 RepID=A0A7X0VG10_9BACL|nr:N-acetylmuramoyl-L-alanine amidase [Cohnella nanjingensis]MBB6672640.1 N-acetylmuramoyl-L-alanine amidase [Cohnella nanjingensis]